MYNVFFDPAGIELNSNKPPTPIYKVVTQMYCNIIIKSSAALLFIILWAIDVVVKSKEGAINIKACDKAAQGCPLPLGLLQRALKVPKLG